MKAVTLVASVCLLCAATLTGAAEDPFKVAVLDLGKHNFDEIIKTSNFVLNMKGDYMELAQTLKKSNPDVRIAAVDVMKEYELGERFEIRGFPTMKWFVDGKYARDYGGKREAAIMLDFVTEMVRPKTEEIKTVEELKEKEAEANTTVIGYFDDLNDGSKEMTTFAKLSVKFGMIFLETTSAQVAAAAGIKSKPGVAIIRNYAGVRETVPLESKITKVNLVPFIQQELLPRVISFGKESAAHVFGAGVERHLILWTKSSDLQPKSSLFKTFSKVANDYKGKYAFITVDKDNEEDAKPVTVHFNLTVAPTLFGFWMPENKKYFFDNKKKMNEANIKEFIEDFAAGKLSPWYNSAPLPKVPTEDGVTVVVGKNFDSIVLDEKKDVLLYVYRPDCEECMKEIDSVLTKVASRFSKVHNVTIAKIDVTDNQHEILDKKVKAIPNIFFFPAIQEKPVVFFQDAERDVDLYTKFIKYYAKTEFELPKRKKSKSEDAEDDSKEDEDAEGGDDDDDEFEEVEEVDEKEQKKDEL